MAKGKKARLPAVIQHGWHILSHVIVDAYNEELKDKGGFLGDRANKGAFRIILEKWRTNVAGNGTDPFGDAITRMAEMIEKLMKHATEEKLRVAPFIAVGCPGLITRDGTIEKGAQNLPGDWEEHDFSLSGELTAQLPLISGHEPLFVIHNDAVVQGLSEAGNMRDVEHWGVFTIGTGLGNARFTNRL
jgi:predicted NBD/HSP70 family sugar kinase